jgi:ferredoxin
VSPRRVVIKRNARDLRRISPFGRNDNEGGCAAFVAKGEYLDKRLISTRDIVQDEILVRIIGGEMRIIIDKDKCKGHNNCISIAPNVFEVDEKFKAFVLDPKGDSDEDILKAAKACPELAIILEDEISGKQIFPGPDDKPRNQLGGSKWGG